MALDILLIIIVAIEVLTSICFLLFIIYGLPIALRLFTKRIETEKELKNIIKKEKERLGLDSKIILAVMNKKVKKSEAGVIEKYKQYKIFIKVGLIGNRKATVIHELYHIKSGQSDLLKDLPQDSFKGFLYNAFFDILANYYSITYLFITFIANRRKI